MLLGIFSWIGDFFKALFDMIPKTMYLLYASFACVLDVLQLFFRKLAGLDVYYIDGKPVGGDIVTNFITGILGINSRDSLHYSALSTVFWSMVVFGIIMCFACTIFAIIKSHYTYDEKAAKGPMQYVYTAGKAILNMAVVPVIVVLGLYVSEAVLNALDTITSTNSGTIEQTFGKDVCNEYFMTQDTSRGATGVLNENKTYIYYDIFGFSAAITYGTSKTADDGWAINNDNWPSQGAYVGAKSQPFSGSLFRVAAYNANRVRIGTMSIEKSGLYRQFTGSPDDPTSNFLKNAENDQELADMIDMLFANHIHLKWEKTAILNYGFSPICSFKYFTNFLSTVVHSFSKFNVGLVWYYYDLWSFNFIVGFAGCIVCLSIFINIILGLITRLFMCIVLFLVAPPLFGLAPLDGGKGGKGWKENFMKQVLMAYGAVVGMNLVLMILPYMNDIDFFNIPMADYLAQTLMIIVGLITIKAVIATLSGLIGAADANEAGGKIKDEVGDTIGKATKMTIGAAKLGKKAFDKVPTLQGIMQSTIGAKLAQTSTGQWASKTASNMKSRVLGGKINVAKRDENGNIMKDANGKTIMEEKEVGGLKGFIKGGKWTKQSIVQNGLKMDAENAEAKELSRRGKMGALGRQSVRDKMINEQQAKVDEIENKMMSATGLSLSRLTKQRDKESKKLVDMKGDDGHGANSSYFAAEKAKLDKKRKTARTWKDRNNVAAANMQRKIDAVANDDKDNGGIFSQAFKLGGQLAGSDSGIGKFNDSSGIKKKPDHDKATADNTKEIAKTAADTNAQIGNMATAIQDLANELKKKP